MSGEIPVAAATDGALARRIMDAAPGHARAEEAELCARFAPRIRLYGLRHLRDEQAAADLVQRVLLLALQKLRARGIREPDRIASFLLGTARMMTREAWRAAQREEPLDAETEEIADRTPPDPEPLARAHMARCLGELRERERSVLVLTYYQERGAETIAAALGIQPGNVRVIRHRAIAQLRACMGLAPEMAS